jgi:hypothetical protein
MTKWIGGVMAEPCSAKWCVVFRMPDSEYCALHAQHEALRRDSTRRAVRSQGCSCSHSSRGCSLEGTR